MSQFDIESFETTKRAGYEERLATTPPSWLPLVLLPLGFAVMIVVAFSYGDPDEATGVLAELMLICAVTVPITFLFLFVLAAFLKTSFGTVASAFLNLSAFLVFSTAVFIALFFFLGDNSFGLALATFGFGLVNVLLCAKLFDLDAFESAATILILGGLNSALISFLRFTFGLIIV